MKGSISVGKLKFKNGKEVELKPDSIVLFVGANNAGKSLALREVDSALTAQNSYSAKRFIIDEVEAERNGTIEDLLEVLKNTKDKDGNYVRPARANNPGGSVAEMQLRNTWSPPSQTNNPTGHLAHIQVNLSEFFVKKLETSDRLTLVAPSQSIAFGTRPTTPIQVLKVDTPKEHEFSKLFRKAFNQDLIVNHNNGGTIPLHVGERPVLTQDSDRVSSEYSKKLLELGQLQDQGDGMKSFAGVFLSLFAENYSINIIDEPEAFLHPPQARLLGEMLAKKLAEDKQLFISTHSEDLLKGLLSFAGSRLIVIRLKRDGDNAETSVLNNAELEEIWKEPILKHSNVLDGLFHSKVVLCESEGDSRLFSAVAAALIDDHDLGAPDIHYIQCGGKSQFPTVITALKKLNVPITAIGDIDVLNDDVLMKKLLKAFGGDWDEIKDDWKSVKDHIESKKPPVKVSEITTAINDILDGIVEENITKRYIEDLKDVMKVPTGWSVAKKNGRSIISDESINISFNRMQAYLKSIGLIILDIGEIECFVPSIGGHGPSWVNKVLNRDITNDVELEGLRVFVKQNILER